MSFDVVYDQVGNHLFNGVDGYGHGDIGRDTLEEIYASLFGAEVSYK
jgi:cystathionine beta-lyase family protein involved in aluminum resistance